MMQLTEQEKIQIVNLHEEGKSIEFLRKRFKRGPVTIEKILLDSGVGIKKSRGNDIEMNDLLVEEIINLHSKNFTPSEIARTLNISSSTTVRNKLLLLGLYETKFPDITEEDKVQINNLYREGLTSIEVADKLNISKVSVLKFIEGQKREKFDYRTYDVDREFFDNIDTQEKAYWLGVMFADGYNSEERSSIRFGQAESNSELVYKFKEALRSEHPVVIVSRENRIHPFYQITIPNRNLSISLAKHGCIQAKTHFCDYPDIDSSLDSHFIRGYFDGDGSIWTSDNRLNISITGNKDLIEKIQKKLMEGCNLNETKLSCRRPESPNIVEIRYGGTNQVARIFEYLYKDSNIHFSKKFEKFNNVKNSIDHARG